MLPGFSFCAEVPGSRAVFIFSPCDTQGGAELDIVGWVWHNGLVGRERANTEKKVGTEMTKMILASRSQGERGQNGKKKIYEIVVSGTCVIVRWGKAEEDKRQSQTKWFNTPYQAEMFAHDKKWEKIDKGYELVLVA